MIPSQVFKPWLIDLPMVRAAGVMALREGRDQVLIESRFVAALPSGLRVAPAKMTIKVEVTALERAAGAFRGESREDIAARETEHAAVVAASSIMDAIGMAESSVRLFRAEMEKILSGAPAQGSARKLWRVRALAAELRDIVDDHPGAGVPLAVKDRTDDLLAIHAFVPASPPADLPLEGVADRILAALKRDDAVFALSLVEELGDAAKAVWAGAPEVFTEPLPRDIAEMTSDMAVRNLLEQAADLRHRGAEFASSDPTRAAEVMRDALDIENRALARLREAGERAASNDLADSSCALNIQADMKLQK